MLYFGPAGVPNACKSKNTINGIKIVKKLGLDAMELEFVYGVKIKENQAKIIKKVACENKIILTAHAPYFINLNAKEKAKVEKSIKMLYQSAKIAYFCGCVSICFHPGWYLKKPKEQAYKTVKENLTKVIKLLEEEEIKITVRPETMESLQKFGDLHEVIMLSQEVENVLPCIDFAHLRYRYGKNSEEFYRWILEELEKNLGKKCLKNLHIHMSGIKLDKKGTHLNLRESDLLWETIIDLLKEFDVEGIIISESPNLEEDAILMKKYYLKKEVTR